MFWLYWCFEFYWCAVSVGTATVCVTVLEWEETLKWSSSSHRHGNLLLEPTSRLKVSCSLTKLWAARAVKYYTVVRRWSLYIAGLEPVFKNSTGTENSEANEPAAFYKIREIWLKYIWWAKGTGIFWKHENRPNLLNYRSAGPIIRPNTFK
jgi:hypothetical protein